MTTLTAKYQNRLKALIEEQKKNSLTYKYQERLNTLIETYGKDTKLSTIMMLQNSYNQAS